MDEIGQSDRHSSHVRLLQNSDQRTYFLMSVWSKNGMLCRSALVIAGHYACSCVSLKRLGGVALIVAQEAAESLVTLDDRTLWPKTTAVSVASYFLTIRENFRFEIHAGKNPIAAQMACLELERELTFIALAQ